MESCGEVDTTLAYLVDILVASKILQTESLSRLVEVITAAWRQALVFLTVLDPRTVPSRAKTAARVILHGCSEA